MLWLINHKFQKYRGLQQTLISRWSYVSVAGSPLLWLFSISLPFWRQEREHMRRREHMRADGNMQWLLKCLLPSGVRHICSCAIVQSLLHSQANSHWTRVEICPPVGSHLAIVSVYNPLKGTELIIANDTTVCHVVCVFSFCHWMLFSKYLTSV